MPPPRSPMSTEFPSRVAANDAEALAQLAPEDRYTNRELSWLSFNRRVLAESENERYPLLERLRFLSISGSNLDEFFMVRVAGLRAQVRAGVTSLSQDGRTPIRQFTQVNSRAIKLMIRQQDSWRVLQKELADHGVAVVHPADLDGEAQLWLDDHFAHEIFPVLTPLAADPAHPFPFIPNGGMSLALSLRRAEDGFSMSALLPLPHQIPRFIRLPGRPKKPSFVKVEDVICRHLDSLFPGFEVEEAEHFRILRDSDVEIEEKAEDLLLEFESLVKKRRRGSAISLRVSSFMSKEMRDSIIEELDVQEENVFQASDLVGIGDLSELIVPERRDLLFETFVPRFPERIRDFDGDHFAAIRTKDLLVHHPYESFDVVVDFIRQAANDRHVVAIKQALYRAGAQSEVVEALVDDFAAQWLNLRRVVEVVVDPNQYPNYDETLLRAFTRETELFVGSTLLEDRSVTELLDADYTFVNERLADHYDIPYVVGTDFRRVQLGEDSPRRGLLGKGLVLLVTSRSTRTSPVVRGKWILENLLGTPPPAPPPNVPPLPEQKQDDGQVLTVRELMARHRANPVCASCHRLMDPPGFALEEFDAVGRYRTRNESNAPIDASGVLPDGTAFEGVAGLRKALLGRPILFVTTLTEKLLTYAVGRGVEYHDAPAIRAITREAARDGHRRFSSLILGVINSPPFQMRTTRVLN